jgi:type IV secretion system protein TrbI
MLQNQSVSPQAGAAVGQQVGQLGVEVTRRNLNIQSTIKVRPGFRFFVRVEKDIHGDPTSAHSLSISTY